MKTFCERGLSFAHDILYFYLAPQYHSLMSDRKDKSVTGEKLMMTSSGEAEQAATKQRGRRELQTIEIETYENEDPEGGPWVLWDMFILHSCPCSLNFIYKL